MHNRTTVRIIVAALLLMPFAANSQSSSINTFSPYTFYGLGDMSARNTAATSGMAGVGVAGWSPYAVNVLNPAAHSSIRRNSFVFSMGLSGKSDYLKSSATKSSYNSFNINDISLMFPLGKGIGFGMSVAPFSTVGYRVQQWEADNNPDVGLVRYKHAGEGGISQIKAGIGVQVATGLSVGADLLYYMGAISRTYGQDIIAVATGTINSISVLLEDEVSSVHWEVGAQYDVIRNPDRILTIGATYQPKGKLRSKITEDIASTSSMDSISNESYKTSIDFGDRITAGVFYRGNKLAAGFDFTFQDWSDSYESSVEDNVKYKKMNSYNIGIQYTPNAMDVRRVMNRWSYRAGFRYVDTYLNKNGKNIKDMAVTFGVGIPIRQDGTEFSVGLEAGQMGTKSNGLIKDNYLKVSLGINIVSGRWFEKRKIN